MLEVCFFRFVEGLRGGAERVLGFLERGIERGGVFVGG